MPATDAVVVRRVAAEKMRRRLTDCQTALARYLALLGRRGAWVLPVARTPSTHRGPVRLDLLGLTDVLRLTAAQLNAALHLRDDHLSLLHGHHLTITTRGLPARPPSFSANEGAHGLKTDHANQKDGGGGGGGGGGQPHPPPKKATSTDELLWAVTNTVLVPTVPRSSLRTATRAHVEAVAVDALARSVAATETRVTTLVAQAQYLLEVIYVSVREVVSIPAPAPGPGRDRGLGLGGYPGYVGPEVAWREEQRRHLVLLRKSLMEPLGGLTPRKMGNGGWKVGGGSYRTT